MLSTFYHEIFELELLYLKVGRITVFYARVLSIGDNGARVNTVAIFSHFSCSAAVLLPMLICFQSVVSSGLIFEI